MELVIKRERVEAQLATEDKKLARMFDLWAKSKGTAKELVWANYEVQV